MTILHPTHTYPALFPRYVSRFHCIGPDCEDTCCMGWRIAIDKKTFNAYRQATHPELAGRFGQKIKRQRNDTSNARYARIELRPDTQECPFLEERMCAIHRELGEDYLSDVCFGYPRDSRNFGGHIQQALTLSCPEAARLALLDAEAFDFLEGPVTLRADSVSVIKPKQGMPLELMNDIWIFCLRLMRTEGLPLWQKLGVLGVFCDDLTKTLAKGSHAEVPSMLEAFIATVEDGRLLGALAPLQPDHAIQAQFFAVSFLSGKSMKLSAVQDRVWTAVAKGLEADKETGQVGAEVVEHYVNGVSRLPEALQATPYLLEHYVLNEMFRTLFPFAGASPFDHYLRIVSCFGVVRLMLAAQCNTAGALPDTATLVQTVHVFCRLYQHNNRFASQVSTALTSTQWNTFDNVCRFLRA